MAKKKIKRRKRYTRQYQKRTKHYDSDFDNDNVMTSTEVAKMLRLHEVTILKYFNDGILPGKKFGTTIRFWRPNIEGIFKDGKTTTLHTGR